MEFKKGDLIYFQEWEKRRAAIVVEFENGNLDYIYCDQKGKSSDDIFYEMPACYMPDFENRIIRTIKNFATVTVAEEREGNAVEDECITTITITAKGEACIYRTWFWVEDERVIASPGFYKLISDTISSPRPQRHFC